MKYNHTAQLLTQFHISGFGSDREDAYSDLQHRYCIVCGDEDGRDTAIGDKSGWWGALIELRSVIAAAPRLDRQWLFETTCDVEVNHAKLWRSQLRWKIEKEKKICWIRKERFWTLPPLNSSYKKQLQPLPDNAFQSVWVIKNSWFTSAPGGANFPDQKIFFVHLFEGGWNFPPTSLRWGMFKNKIAIRSMSEGCQKKHRLQARWLTSSLGSFNERLRGSGQSLIKQRDVCT